jgi:nucleoside-diphosphate-sugar epimerase
MRVLFIGGTGIISTACTQLAAERGIDLTLLTRGQRAADLPSGVESIGADIEDAAGVACVLEGKSFDAVVDWIAFRPEQVERDIELFGGRTRQFLFISSASAYQKPATHLPITESTPLANPFWDYSRNKIACEDRLMRAYREEGFPITIVRPSLTYGESQIPLAVNSWTKSFTVVDRMRRGKKVIVPGDGSSLWVITHNSDFAKGLVGLLGREQAIGHAFHITSDEVMCWDQYYRLVAEAAGAEPQLVHVASDFLAACLPDMRGGLLGDKAVSVVFDNTKIKRFVPDFRATVPFEQGIRRAIAWFDADSARQQIDDEANARWDKLIYAYEQGTGAAVRYFQS